MNPSDPKQQISVIVPESPFIRSKDLHDVKHCLAALDVKKLMEWWPGKPHAPEKNPEKVNAIQRSLDWKRVAQIAAYLLQQEITEASAKLDVFFRPVYEPRKYDPGREWPPRVPNVIGFARSEYPTFSNVLVHVNGAHIKLIEESAPAAKSLFNEDSKRLHFSVIDGQHRINGAYFAVCILQQQRGKDIPWEIPAEIFLDLDKPGKPPRHQAQIFIDVNFYQKKVDRSLVADLFPTARGGRGPLDQKERAQDIGRKLMLETGPLVGMIQIPGIKYGVADVVTLATLNSAIEDVVEEMERAGLTSLEEQTAFLSQFLEAWLDASGRRQEIAETEKLDPENVVYQGRVLVSAINLLPACINELKRERKRLISSPAQALLVRWLKTVVKRAGLTRNNRFVSKSEFRKRGFLGSGGIGRFRDSLWAGTTQNVARLKPEKIAEIASRARTELSQGELLITIQRKGCRIRSRP